MKHVFSSASRAAGAAPLQPFPAQLDRAPQLQPPLARAAASVDCFVRCHRNRRRRLHRMLPEWPPAHVLRRRHQHICRLQPWLGKL